MITLLFAIAIGLSGYSVMKPSVGTFQVTQVAGGFLRTDTRTGATSFCEPKAAEDGKPVVVCTPLPEAR